MANCKSCIKSHKYDICKTIQNHSSFNYSKIQKYDLYVYWKSICQYLIKKYYATYLVKKGKYIDCKDLSPKYTSDCKYFKLNKFIY